MKMAYWLVKSEPSVWSWDMQVAKGAKGEAWTGVRNFTARQNLVNMKKGDKAFFYHSNIGKEVVGIVEVSAASFPDPTDDSGKWVSVKVKPVETLKRPVTLADIKANPKLSECELVKQSRLSVCELRPQEWRTILAMAERPSS